VLVAHARPGEERPCRHDASEGFRGPALRRGAEHGGAHLGEHVLDGHVGREIREAGRERDPLDVPLRRTGAQPADDGVPVGVFREQRAHRLLDVHVGEVGDGGGVADRLVVGPGEPADELQRDGQAPMHVVHRRDLQLRQVKALSEHVHAHGQA
jgi:hypothetical protein